MERNFRIIQIYKYFKYIVFFKFLIEYNKYLNIEETEVNFNYDGRKLFTKNLKTKRVDISILKCYKTYIDIKNYIGNVRYG